MNINASFASSVLDPSVLDPSVLDASVLDQVFISDSSVLQSGLQSSLVVIDLGIEDYQTLVAGLAAETQVLFLNPAQDGIQQITAALQAHPWLTQIHVVSHGAPGCLHLGNTELSLDTLARYTSQLRTWWEPQKSGTDTRFPASSPTAHAIILYGCNVAAGDAGAEFVEKLHHLTGASIAASTTPMGNAALGGNWQLDVTSGDVAITPVFSAASLAAYQGVLAIANDNFANRVLLTGTSFNVTGINIGATSETGEPDVGVDNNSVWWSWTAPSGGSFSLDTLGSEFNTALSIYTGTAVDSLTVIPAADQNTGDGSSQSRIIFTATAGTTYQIAVEGSDDQTGSILLNLSPVVVPLNDNFANRITLTGAAVTTTGNNVGATSEIDEPAQAGTINSVWWSWTAPASGNFTIDTLNSQMGSRLAVFTGTAVNSLTAILEAQTFTGGGANQGQITFAAIAGTTYQIAVDGDSEETGSIALQINPTLPPANDNFANRIILSGATASSSSTTIGATSEIGEPAQAGTINSVWWSWTAPASGNFTFDTVGSPSGTSLSVFTGTAVNSLTAIPESYTGAGPGDSQSRIIFAATAGTTYQIAVDGNNGTGSVALNVSPVVVPTNDNFANRIALTGTFLSTTGTNVGATGETGEPTQGSTLNSVWWSWTAPSAGKFTIDTIGSVLDSYLSVFTGTAVDALVLIDQDDDTTGSLYGFQSRVTFDAVAGTTYQIAVDGFQRQTDPFQLNIGPADNAVPVVAADQSFRVSESSPNGTVVGTVLAKNIDVGQSLTYSILDGNTSNLFTINAATGQVSFANVAALSAIADSKFNLKVQVQDNGTGSLTDDATVVINLEGAATPEIDFSQGQAGDRLKGTAQKDTLVGTKWRDVIRGLGGNDRIEAGSGNDLVKGGSGKDRIDGSNGRDRLLGNDGNDRLTGGKSNDILIGAQGNDILIGNQGRDLFVFQTLAEGVDRITDFSALQDRIDLRAIFTGAAFGGTSPFDRLTQFVQLVQVGANTEVQVDTDGSGVGTSFTTLATLLNVTSTTIGSRNFVIA